MDATCAPVKAKHAYWLKQTTRVNDTLWEINLYKKNGPRISSIQSNTADGGVRNGYWISYDSRGYADTIGYYSHGDRDGHWALRSGNRYLGQQYYEHDKLIWQKDSATLHQEWLDDSAKAIAAGKPDIFKHSSYPGGDLGWLRYLNKHLRYPDDALNNSIMGEVRVNFRLDQQGELKNEPLLVIKSICYSLDQESLAVIADSGQWNAEIEFGEKVKSWKCQPVVYRFK
jgi:hypothetical protein